jgi:isopropylmalate/homocitrate/citramalate synthase|tara:strand:- start:271 stop:510 length:240 start_codon:yes stop_codon:yes gene_type:complete
MDIESVAKAMGIILQGLELDRVRKRIKVKQDKGKTVTNKEAENIIKSVVKKPFSPHLEKKGGYIKKYARGSIVRKVRGY